LSALPALSAPYSGLIPAFFTSFAHCRASARKNAANPSAQALAVASAPPSA